MILLPTEDELTRRQQYAEDYEDSLDMLHPDDAISPEVSPESYGLVGNGKLALVVGHTRRSPGAVGTAPIGENEYFWNRTLARIVREFAAEYEIGCGVFYRDGVGISGAYKQLVDWGATSCIELHFNAYDGQVAGTETLHGVHDLSEIFANSVHSNIVKVLKRHAHYDRGVKRRALGERGGRSVNILTQYGTPSCLIEPFFGDSRQDALLGDSSISGIAKALVVSHVDYMSGV